MIGNRPASANDHVGLERYMLMARQYFTSFVSVCCFVTSVTAFPNLIEEMLRLETPIQGSFRLARRNTSVGGVDRPAGTTVLVAPGAPTATPFRAPRPVRTGPSQRAPTPGLRPRHPHLCRCGLARAEARHCEYIQTYFLQGLTNLHLEFSPAKG